MTNIENGLLELETRSATRRTPNPRNPKRETEVPPPPAPVSVVDLNAETAPADQVAQPAAPARPAPKRAPKATPEVTLTELKATQVHLDGVSRDFLRHCSAAGLMEGSRDVTNSGVIRFALARLAADLTPELVAKTMLAGDPALRRPGRRVL